MGEDLSNVDILMTCWKGKGGGGADGGGGGADPLQSLSLTISGIT